MRRFVGCLGLVCLLLLGVAVPAGAATFGLDRFDVTFSNRDGAPTTQAGSHPFEMTTSLHVAASPTAEGGELLVEEVKDLELEQAVGFIGNPTAVPRCTSAEFLKFTTVNGANAPSCPNSTAVGTVEVRLASSMAQGAFYMAVYNLVPPPGVPAMLGFVVVGEPITIELGVSEAAPYRIVGGPHSISQLAPFVATRFTLWGVPADPVHDALRGHCISAATGESRGLCEVGLAEVPFLTMPRACEGPLGTGWAIDSWSHPGGLLANGRPDLRDPLWVSGSVLTHDGGEPPLPLGMTGCESVGFDATVGAKPTDRAASSPTGLEFTLDVEDEGLENPEGVAQSDIKKVEVALPESMSVNPALAEGLSACSEADLAKETIFTAEGQGCPEESEDRQRGSADAAA